MTVSISYNNNKINNLGRWQGMQHPNFTHNQYFKHIVHEYRNYYSYSKYNCNSYQSLTLLRKYEYLFLTKTYE